VGWEETNKRGKKREWAKGKTKSTHAGDPKEKGKEETGNEIKGVSRRENKRKKLIVVEKRGKNV